MEEKFDNLNQRRRKDREDLESQLIQIKKKKQSNFSFKFKSNKIQYDFLADVLDTLEEARDLSNIGSRKRLNEELDGLISKVAKR